MYTLPFCPPLKASNPLRSPPAFPNAATLLTLSVRHPLSNAKLFGSPRPPSLSPTQEIGAIYSSFDAISLRLLIMNLKGKSSRYRCCAQPGHRYMYVHHFNCARRRSDVSHATDDVGSQSISTEQRGSKETKKQFSIIYTAGIL